MAKKKVADFPPSILVRIAYAGDSENEYLACGTTPDEVADDVIEGGSLKTARYVLAGAGTIEYVAPAYVEDEKA